MSKKIIRISVFAVFALILSAAAVIWHNNDALAQNQPQKKTSAEMMAIYSAKGKENTKSNIRISRLTQMNIVSEAANVLNVLPINIIDEMKKGKTLEQIANEKGFTKDQFLQKLTDYENKTIAAAATAGEITDKHETALKQGQKDRLTKSLTEKANNVNNHQPMDMGN